MTAAELLARAFAGGAALVIAALMLVPIQAFSGATWQGKIISVAIIAWGCGLIAAFGLIALGVVR